MVLTRLRAGRRAALRPAQEEDLQSAADLLSTLFAEGAFEGQPPTRDDLSVAAFSGALFVADAFSDICGVLLLRSGLIGIAVHPAFRRQRIGSALIELARARRTSLSADVRLANTASRALFLTAGFVPAEADAPQTLRFSWQTPAPVTFTPLELGWREYAGGRPGGLLVQRGGRFVLLDPVGGDGFAQALSGLPVPTEILITREPSTSLRLAALGTSLPVVASLRHHAALLGQGILPDAEEENRA